MGVIKVNKEMIWSFFKDAGLSDAGAAGLMGNIKILSDFNPINLEDSFEEKLNFTDETYTAAIDEGDYNCFSNDGAGYGLMQWKNYAKKLSLLAYAKIEDKSIGDLNLQLNFIKKDMEKHYSKTWNFLKETKDIYEATIQVLTIHETPEAQTQEMKEKYYNSAKDIYKDFIKSDNLINENDEQKEKNGNEKLVEISNNPQYTNGIAAEIVNGIWGNNWRESLILKIEETIEGLRSIVNKPEQYYKVVAGDTLTKIANRFNTTVERIINDNSVIYPAIEKSYLNVGWILKI